jgi:hypothetical protein
MVLEAMASKKEMKEGRWIERGERRGVEGGIIGK